MRIQTESESGNAFLIVMVTTGILSAVCLGSYLALASTEHRAVSHSIAWNTAIPLAEAGAEEALSHIAKNSANFATDGWSLQGTNAYTKRRTLAGGDYNVEITGSGGALLTVNSTGNALLEGNTYISRTVQVTAQKASSLPKSIGLVAKNGITFFGDFNVDSYDSTDPALSTYGRYDPAKYADLANVATPGGFSMGGHSKIYGYAECAPGFTVTAGGGATVGDKAYVNSKNKGIQQTPTNHFSATFTNAIPDIQPPFTSAAKPGEGTVSGTTYNYVLAGGQYMASSLDAGGGLTTMAVTANSVLYVTGPVSLANITIAPGATLDLYIATPEITFLPTLTALTGSDAATPPQFRVWGLPSCTSMKLTGGSEFTGVIYAPEANLWAEGNTTFYGAITARTFTCQGGFNLHYDAATANYVPPTTQFKVLSWKEL